MQFLHIMDFGVILAAYLAFAPISSTCVDDTLLVFPDINLETNPVAESYLGREEINTLKKTTYPLIADDPKKYELNMSFNPNKGCGDDKKNTSEIKNNDSNQRKPYRI